MVYLRIDKQIQVLLKSLMAFDRLSPLMQFAKILQCSVMHDIQKINFYPSFVSENYPTSKSNLVRIQNKNKYGKEHIFKNYMPGAFKDIIFINIVAIINRTIFRNSKYLYEAMLNETITLNQLNDIALQQVILKNQKTRQLLQLRPRQAIQILKKEYFMEPKEL